MRNIIKVRSLIHIAKNKGISVSITGELPSYICSVLASNILLLNSNMTDIQIAKEIQCLLRTKFGTKNVRFVNDPTGCKYNSNIMDTKNL